MKRFHSLVIAGLALALSECFGASAFAETLLPTADTSSTLTFTKANPPIVTKTAITASAGKSGSLIVSKTRHAFIQFNAADKLTAEGLTAADIMSAKLTIYFPSAGKAGQIDLHLVMQPWTEKPTGLETEPLVASGTIDSVPAARVIAKQFFSFDVTSAVMGWLTASGTDHGFALESPDGLANVTIGAKEGSGSGYPATLEIETISGTSYSSIVQGGDGNIGIGVSTPAYPLDVYAGTSNVHILGGQSAGGTGVILENDDGSIHDWLLAAGDSAGTFGSTKGFFIRDNTNNATRLAIDTIGDVGIGTATPALPLDVNVGLKDARITGNASFGGNGLILENTDVTTQQWFLGAGDNAGTSGPSKGFYIQNFNSGVVGLAISTGGNISANGNITTNGNVGIGTTNPAHKLDIIAGGEDVRISGNISFGGNGLILENTDVSTQQWFLGAGDNAGTSGPSKGFYIQNFNTGLVGLAINTNGDISANGKITTTGNISTNGSVGIGSTSPTQAKLVVNGSVTSGSFGQHGFLISTGASSSASGSGAAVSISASNDVHASAFRAFSDARIKNIQGHSDSAHDLLTLRGIEITDYVYKDTITKGDRPQKKVVAQQVEKVFPQAVSQSTEVVPDIYHKAGIKEGWVNLATDLKVADRVRLIAEKTEGIYPVLEVKDGAFRTEFQPEGAEVFVYGREVNDFRAVDYEAISMLNVSATQELAKKLEAKETEMERLRTENTALKQQVTAIETRLNRIEAQLAPSVALASELAK